MDIDGVHVFKVMLFGLFWTFYGNQDMIIYVPNPLYVIGRQGRQWSGTFVPEFSFSSCCQTQDQDAWQIYS